MDVIQWLEENVEFFHELTQEERSAPMHFSLLWSYFEAEALGTTASAEAIERWICNLSNQNRLNAEAFNLSLSYFKNRYFACGQFTDNFQTLNLRSNDKEYLVKDVISGQNTDPTNCVVAIFIIIYRFRNNYFHGTKWTSHLKEQLANFTTANHCIMNIINMSKLR